jgi:hypothetical protein
LNQCPKPLAISHQHVAGSLPLQLPLRSYIRRAASTDGGRGMPWWHVMQFTTGAGPLSFGTFEM